MTAPPRQRPHLEVLEELVTLAGRDVVDVGCGDGWLTRAMTKRGARVIGIECGEAALARARAAPPAGGERYLFGHGEALPLPGGSADLVVYFNSLHHVTVAVQPAALREAARVLRPGGQLYVLEPIAEGRYFEMVRPFDDETAIRAAALAAIRAAAADGLVIRHELVYVHPARYADFATYLRGFLAVDPERAAVVRGREAEFQARFEATALRQEDGWFLDHPMRAHVLDFSPTKPQRHQAQI